MKELIDRKALLAEYDRVHIGPPGGARKLMEDAPAVDAVEVVHGRWIYDYDTFIQDNGYESEPIHTGFVCSVCGRHSFAIEPYCHCGAKMDGVEDNG